MIRHLPVVVIMLLQPMLSFLTSISQGEDHWKAGRVSKVSYFVTATVYHADPRQCDDDFTITADGSQIDTMNPSAHRWIAVSRDMLAKHGGTLRFGDSLRVEGTNSHLDGIHVVRDVMNKRYRKCIDFLVSKDDIYGRWERVMIAKI